MKNQTKKQGEKIAGKIAGAILALRHYWFPGFSRLYYPAGTIIMRPGLQVLEGVRQKNGGGEWGRGVGDEMRDGRGGSGR